MVTGNILVGIRTLLGQALSPAGTTGDAATLWRWVELGEGDLVITDVVMPDENAFEILPKMKKARSSDHRHERAEFTHDRDQGVRARRL